MLRLTVLLLLLANAAYFAWSQGLLAPWGIAPAQQSEPQRLQQQIKPQTVRILDREEAARMELAAASGTQECLQAGLFEERELPGLKAVLERWPPGSWLLEPESALAERELRGQLLRLPAVDDSLRSRLPELRFALNGKSLRPCR